MASLASRSDGVRMQLLTFHVNEDRYAIETKKIREVLPVVKLMPLPFSNSCVSGLLNYRGQAVPVIDLNKLISGKPAHLLMSSRMIIIRYPVARDDIRLLALLAEQATEIIKHDESIVQDYGLSMDQANFLGKIIYDDHGMIQLVDPENLLSEAITADVFRPLEEPDEVRDENQHHADPGSHSL